MGFSRAQHDTLTKPLSAGRVSKRSQGGKTLSYLEAWDVKAHLIRLFGYGNFDSEVIDCYHVATRDYMTTPREGEPKPMVEVIWYARVKLTIRSGWETVCTYTEAAVGNASGPPSMLGEHHDNAVKTAASDALKRCAINLGTQFGLSLYDNGNTQDVVRKWLVVPDEPSTPDAEEAEGPSMEEAAATLKRSLGAEVVEEEPPA